nr:MAG TPA: hypothetical protein [Caudoviricetes sp.]
MKKMTNEQYWLRRDRSEKMESLYGRPIGFPEDVLNPRPGIVQNLVFSALLVGISTIVYFIYINIK